MMQVATAYHIGAPGVPWGEVERAAWLAERVVQRSYHDIVLSRLEAICKTEHVEALFAVDRYGALSHDPSRYPLLYVQSRTWSPDKPCVLITGGVHGYETSGVLGAMRFLEEHATKYAEHCNLLIAPCVSPWAFEHIQRWNAAAVDPNRSFRTGMVPDGAGAKQEDDAIAAGSSWRGAPAALDNLAEESVALARLIASRGAAEWLCHVDLHETTDSDEGEFIPAKAARDGHSYVRGEVPDGFYVVGDAGTPLTASEQASFLGAVVAAVRCVTHIAPADADGRIINEVATQEGVIMYPYAALGLCGSAAAARFAATTEVYPDSTSATEEECTAAQVAAVCGALDHVLGL